MLIRHGAFLRAVVQWNMTDTLTAASPLPSTPALSDLLTPSKTGRSHGTSSKEPFDRWFRYPAGFASDHVEHLLAILNISEGAVIDCFAGSGVTGTAARTVGLGFYGIEAHPMIAELASIKLNVDVCATDLVPLAKSLATASARPEALRSQIAAIPNETDLVRRSFDDATLSRLMSLRHCITDREPDELSIYMKWALLGTLRDVASVKVGWPYQLPGKPKQAKFVDVAKRFLARVDWMATDLGSLTGDEPKAVVRLGDSRAAESWPDASSMQASIASPPYLNNFDYADATRLEAYFWGEVRTWKELTSTIRGEMLTATTQQSSKVEKEAALETLMAYPSIHRTVNALARDLKAERGRRPPGAKAYDQVAPAYFLAISDILRNLASVLETGATSVWQIGDSAPYGIYVDTPRIIGEIAGVHGFEVRSDTTIRERGNRWKRANSPVNIKLGERVLCFQKS